VRVAQSTDGPALKTNPEHAVPTPRNIASSGVLQARNFP